MKISFSATNPCHIYDQALGVFECGSLGVFYSGYPRWRLKPPPAMTVVEASWRTLVTYGLQRLPEWARPPDQPLFRWQDAGFDRQVDRLLDAARSDVLHAIPGQALKTFTRARELGVVRVLNHAIGPLNQVRELVRPEYERVGRRIEETLPLPLAWVERLDRELALADFHCVASNLVKQQLGAEGIDPDRIQVIPYGVDEELFRKREAPPPGPFRVCFAGRQSLLKGIKHLLDALELVSEPDWELHLFGMAFAETAADFAAYRGPARIVRHGPVPQARFAAELQRMHALVLPSAAEAFGLVVVQALQCGVPCIVSDRVGARDIIRDGETGTVFPFGAVPELAEALRFWDSRRGQVADTFSRVDAARALVAATASGALGKAVPA